MIAAPMDPHRLAEERSLELHRAVAERLRGEPELRERALRRVVQWQKDGSVHPHYAQLWEQVLSGSIDDICALLVERSERALALRSVTPFAGVIDPRERWRIWKAVKERRSADATS